MPNRLPPALGVLHKSFFDQERLIHLPMGPDLHSKPLQWYLNHRSATEFLNDGRQDFIINLIQTKLIYIQCFKGIL